MRRQARISVGGAFVVRTASALQVWLWLLLFVFQNQIKISKSIEPGYLDFDNLPDTNFTCVGKVIGGYYADLETSCQMFHVCTVGQHDEPMDIKFLCLNGTVFDQETRVCERVDEVDCTKSERFYSLNLELYGSTSPSVIQMELQKSPTKSTESSKIETNFNSNNDGDPSLNDSQNEHKNIGIPSNDFQDSTEDPQDLRQTSKIPPSSGPQYLPPAEEITDHVEPEEENQEEEEEDSELPEYKDDYIFNTSPTTSQSSTSSTSTPATTTNSPINTGRPSTSKVPSLLHSTNVPLSAVSPLVHSTPTAPTSSLDPALLSPQEFIYRHRGPGSEVISFQRQSFRPADGVYITHAPPPVQQFDHFQYESSRTAPRPPAARPNTYANRPHPSPFRVTTPDSREQLLRPGQSPQSSQSSERHETAIKHRPQSYSSHIPLPVQRPLPFDPFYFERKRSDDISSETEQSLAPRSAAPPTVSEKTFLKPKSPPRVIVTASASVSDSNGKRLNYTVGNVVSAVKPIVQINYDDYKESDLIFDPFFLDVPKLQKRRKTRENKNRIVVVPIATTKLKPIITTTQPPPVKTSSPSTISGIATTPIWNPNDYVDDNYEPHAFLPPAPPLAFILPIPHSTNKIRESRPSSTFDNPNIEEIITEETKLNLLESSTQLLLSSSQEPVQLVQPLPTLSGSNEEHSIELSKCIQPQSERCRTRV